jgi:hypothetical protein
LTVQADSQVLEQLPQWQEKAPRYIGLHRDLLQLKASSSFLPTLEEHIAAIAAALRSEIDIPPVLRFNDLLPIWPELENLFHEAVTVICAHLTNSPSDASALRQFSNQSSLIKSTAERWYNNHFSDKEPIEPNIHPGILSLCFKAAFHPVLVRYAEVLTPLIKQQRWRKNICPVCGGMPDFAFLEREVGARWLMCSRCDAEWVFSRLECPFCRTRDQNALSYSTDDKQLYRLYTCDHCRNYIKAIDLRHTENDVLLPLERILTLDMDRQAIKAGYSQESTTFGSPEDS